MIAFPIVLMSTVSTILVSVLVPVFAIALLVGVFLFLRRKAVSGYEKMVSDYESYHGQLTSSCKNMVNRLKSLGEYSPSFQKSYEERSKQYEDILERRDKNLRQSLESLSQLREGKNFKAFKGLLSQTQISLNDYEKAVSNFNEDLTSLLRDDIDTRDSSLQSKNMLRRIRDFYSEHEDDLRSLKESFELLFENAESTFATFEDDVNQAKFKEARDLLPKISSVLSAVLAILGDLPSLVTRVEKVIPESLKDMEEKYHAMLQEGFVLDYLKVPEVQTETKEELTDIRKRLRLLDTRGVKGQLDRIQSTITDILAKFAEERRAKESFLGNQGDLSNTSFELEKRYSRHMNQLAEYQRTYVLDRKYVEQMYALKDDIEKIGFLKRDIDSYVETKERQPYTLITKRISDMQAEISKITRTMDDYSHYLQSLKNDSQAIYQNLRALYLGLKEEQWHIRQINLPSIEETYKSRFEKLYRDTKAIDDIILKAPVDVSKAKEAFEPYRKECEALIKDVQNKYEQCQKAEQSYVYANAFRLEFSDSRPLLVTAEKAFNEGDFDRASDEALKVVRIFSSTKNNDKNA